MSNSSYFIGKMGTENSVDDIDSTDEELRDKMVKRINNFFDYFNLNIRNAEYDLKFLVEPNAQWDADLFAQRTQSKKPCFQINQITPIVNSIIGMERQNTADFKVFNYVDENNPKVKINQDDIDLRDNYLRQVSFETNSAVHFQTCFANQLKRGYGALIVGVKYESEMSFNQVPFLQAAIDPTICFWDPSDKSHDKTEGDWSGYIESFTWEEFKSTYPNSVATKKKIKPSSFPVNTSTLTLPIDRWQGEEYINVAHCYVRIKYPIKIYKMSDGRSLTKEDAEKAIEEDKFQRRKTRKLEKMLFESMNSNQESQINEMQKLDYAYDDNRELISRTTCKEKIMHYIFSEDETLEKTEFPVTGKKYLPIIFADCDSDTIDGAQLTKSFFSTAKDSQRISNYLASAAIENLMNLNKSQFIGTPENFSGLEEGWRDPSMAKGSLVANRDSAGQMPSQLPPPQVSPSYMPLIQQSISDIHQTLGYFESNMGESSNEKSGVAIQERYKRGDLSHFVVRDNLHRSIDKFYKIILSLMPSLLDTHRNIIVRTKNNEQKSVFINEPSADGIINDMTLGNFSVEVTCGSNYQDQLADNFDQMIKIIETIAPSNPQIGLALGDLVAGSTNLKYTPQIVDRIRGLIMQLTPQQILMHEQGLKEPPPPQNQGPNPEMLKIKIQQDHEVNEADRIKIDSEKNQIEIQKMQYELEITKIKSQSDIEIKKIEYQRELVAAKAEESKK